MAGYDGYLIIRVRVHRDVGEVFHDLANVCARLALDNTLADAIEQRADDILDGPLKVLNTTVHWDLAAPDA